MSTPQQDPKRREPGYYHVKHNPLRGNNWIITEWHGDNWTLPNYAQRVADEFWQEIDENKIERGAEGMIAAAGRKQFDLLQKITEKDKRVAELEAQVRELESRLEERINQG